MTDLKASHREALCAMRDSSAQDFGAWWKIGDKKIKGQTIVALQNLGFVRVKYVSTQHGSRRWAFITPKGRARMI
jgi:hypothetical protein